MSIPIPKPCFLDQLEPLGAFHGIRRWRNARGDRLYTWDALHGEIEVFDKRGYHLGALDAKDGRLIKGAVRGRTIDV